MIMSISLDHSYSLEAESLTQAQSSLTRYLGSQLALGNLLSLPYKAGTPGEL